MKKLISVVMLSVCMCGFCGKGSCSAPPTIRNPTIIVDNDNNPLIDPFTDEYPGPHKGPTITRPATSFGFEYDSDIPGARAKLGTILEIDENAIEVVQPFTFVVENGRGKEFKEKAGKNVVALQQWIADGGIPTIAINRPKKNTLRFTVYVSPAPATIEILLSKIVEFDTSNGRSDLPEIAKHCFEVIPEPVD